MSYDWSFQFGFYLLSLIVLDGGALKIQYGQLENLFRIYPINKSMGARLCHSWLGVFATVAEIILAVFLLIGFKTESAARLSGWLLLIFALAMSFSTGIKSALDFSVFSASAGAFTLGTLQEKYLEIDTLLK